LEVAHHIGRGHDFRHLSEARKPSIELITDCDFGIDHKVPLPIGAVRNIRSCSETIHNGVQKVVGEAQVHPLLAVLDGELLVVERILQLNSLKNIRNCLTAA